MIWGEGFRIEGIELLDRTRLHPAGTLVIAFTPPGAEEIKAAMARVKPQKVILLPANPAGDDPRLLQNLVNLIKQQLSAGDGKLTLDGLAGSMGQRTVVIRLALDVLQSAGRIVYTLDSIRQPDPDQRGWYPTWRCGCRRKKAARSLDRNHSLPPPLRLCARRLSFSGIIYTFSDW